MKKKKIKRISLKKKPIKKRPRSASSLYGVATRMLELLRANGESMDVDDIASQLGVTRRRLYDVHAVMSAVEPPMIVMAGRKRMQACGMEKDLDDAIAAAEGALQALHDEHDGSGMLYVTVDDLLGVLRPESLALAVGSIPVGTKLSAKRGEKQTFTLKVPSRVRGEMRTFLIRGKDGIEPVAKPKL